MKKSRFTEEQIIGFILETVVGAEVRTKVARISTTYGSWFFHPKSTAPQLSSLPGTPRQIWLSACPDTAQLRFLGLSSRSMPGCRSMTCAARGIPHSVPPACRGRHGIAWRRGLSAIRAAGVPPAARRRRDPAQNWFSGNEQALPDRRHSARKTADWPIRNNISAETATSRSSTEAYLFHRCD